MIAGKNDVISSAFGVMKINTTHAASFKSPDGDELGYMQTRSRYSSPARPSGTADSEFGVLLMLAHTKTNDPKEIQRIFSEY